VRAIDLTSIDKTCIISPTIKKEVEDMEVVLSPKYQIVIPREVRENLGLEKGQKFAVIVKNGVISLVPVPSLEELRGMAKGIEMKGIRENEDRI